MTDEMIKTGYALYKAGYIEEDGTERGSELIKEMRNKGPLIDFAKIKKLDPHDHYIVSVGYEIIHGLKVPTEGDDYDYLNNHIKK